MNSPFFAQKNISSLSLRVKLVLSHLAVALGAILLMIIVVALAVQFYFYQFQIDQLRANAEDIAQQAAQIYQSNNNSWEEPVPRAISAKAYLIPFLTIIDSQGNILTGSLSSSYSPYNATLQQALSQALQGQETSGSLQDDSNNPDVFSALYVSVPIRLNNQVIGAVLLAPPNRLQRGFLPNGFLATIDQVILIAGLGIMLIVIIFSLWMARRLTRPLVSLTKVAEEMKAGHYDQRVELLKSQDELGKLALTFNSMAEKIAADVNALREQEQLRRDLIANIAHDLVTPLTAIQGYSEAIADDVISSPGERHETAQLIGREVQRLRRLVSDMQNMTSLESGRVPLEIAPLNLHDLVTETLAVIAPEGEQAQITLNNAIDPATPQALADSDRIAQVLLNLLDNARRHTPPGGQITLGARTEGTWLVVWVSDTGVGINAQELPYIFERFYRTDRARSAASGGSGLGLAIVRAIIAAHGGTTWARSAPGQGATIFFTLPRVPDPLSSTASSTSEALITYPVKM